jgi:hypothetical protein
MHEEISLFYQALVALDVLESFKDHSHSYRVSLMLGSLLFKAKCWKKDRAYQRRKCTRY